VSDNEHEHPVTIVDKRGARKPSVEDLSGQPRDSVDETDNERHARVKALLLDGKSLSPEDSQWWLSLSEDTAKPAPNPARSVRAAFLVIINHDGSAEATNDVDAPLSADRMATNDDVYSALAIVKRDIEVGYTTQAMMMRMQAMGQQMNAAQQAAARVQGLGIDPQQMHRR
jgi:hypothetical protein